jgi:5-methylcytosine-specific restriction protein A
MGRLTTVRSRLTPAPRRLPRVDPQQDFDQRRDAANEWRGWYKTKDWQRLRWRVLVRDQFTCRICTRVEAQTRHLVADHIIPHRGQADLFWDDANLQCLCKTCHDSTKQRQERGRG